MLIVEVLLAQEVGFLLPRVMAFFFEKVQYLEVLIGCLVLLN